ncbi:MAG: AAA family ATPase [Propionibacteriaceae bacterium]
MNWTGRPLLDNNADAELFTDRETEREQVDAAVRHGLNVAVIGPSGSGTTSLVRQLQRQWRRADVRCVFVDGRAAGSAAGVLRRVLTGLELDPTDDPRSGIDRLRAVPDRPVVVLDGLPEAAQTHQLFGRLRDELWTTPLRWVVTARDDERATLLLPPANAFFERVVNLPELTAEASRLLLKTRAAGADELPGVLLDEVVAAAAARQPRALLDTARTALARPELVGSLAAMRSELRTRLEEVGGRPAVELAAELQQLGGASASDQRLLDRLGWTRPHATRMLRKLEDARLVTSSELASGTGRPRKVYAVVDPVL